MLLEILTVLADVGGIHAVSIDFFLAHKGFISARRPDVNFDANHKALDPSRSRSCQVEDCQCNSSLLSAYAITKQIDCSQRKCELSYLIFCAVTETCHKALK